MFGQLIMGPPGSGKTTYAHAVSAYLTSCGRQVVHVNLDPASLAPRGAHATNATNALSGDAPARDDEDDEGDERPADINIHSLITVEHTQELLSLGPNGSLLYCMDYLWENFEWLSDALLAAQRRVVAATQSPPYFVFDLPGQVELFINHPSLRKIIYRLCDAKEGLGMRLVSVHLVDSQHLSEVSKYVASVLLSLSVMCNIELPTVNVLSKIDQLPSLGELPFNLSFYTDVQELDYLLPHLDASVPPKFRKLNEQLCDLIENYGLVAFEPLSVLHSASLARLVAKLDKAIGYIRNEAPQPTGSRVGSAPAMVDPDELLFEYERVQQLQDELLDPDP